MKSDIELTDICIEIYKELYKLATPSRDWGDAVESGEALKPNWFMAYYLSEERQDLIIEKHIKKNKLSKYEAHKVRKEIYGGAAPSCCKRATENIRHGVKDV